jgi:FtsZ-interacting cell division protein ZipA
MNTTIIIALGALILIVVIAIIAVLIKGKKSSNEEPGMTFQETPETSTETEMSQATPEPETITPKLHQNTQLEPNNAPTMSNLNQPQQTPPTPQPNIPIPSDEPTTMQQEPMQQTDGNYAPNPLPDQSQMQNDMENLQQAKTSTNNITTEEATTSKEDQDMANIANAINETPQETPQSIPNPQPSVQNSAIPTVEQQLPTQNPPTPVIDQQPPIQSPPMPTGTQQNPTTSIGDQQTTNTPITQ